jgi:DNA-binding NtrC family response regulator
MFDWMVNSNALAASRNSDDNPPVGGDARRSAGDGRQTQKVLVVDDERLVADTITEILNRRGFEALACYSAESALEQAETFEPDILLTDVLMPNINGVQLAVRLTEARPSLKAILISGQAGISSIIENARAAGYAFELLPKPLHPEELIAKLNQA